MLQFVKEGISHYDTFVTEIINLVRQRMGEDYDIKIYKVTKNNALELDSLIMLRKDKNFSPNIYLLPYYEEYIMGAEIKELAEKLCHTYLNYQLPIMSESFSYRFEDVKDFIVYRLVNFQRNKKLLEKIPHIKYLDMAITFHSLVRQDNDGIGTIRITNEHMRAWETTLKELYHRAADNTGRIFPPSIQSMEDMILGMLKEDIMDCNQDEQSETIIKDIIEHQNSDRKKIYILTNQKGINGATCLLYENVLKNFANQIQCDLFILPSSIHEVLMIPYDRTMTRELLSEMVRDVNHTQVARDEILSDSVYLYSRRNNTLTM